MGERLKSSFVNATLPPKTPNRAIFLWYGSLASIPYPFKVCDGTLGTPDLRGVFVCGSDTPGEIGGSATHDHAFTSNNHTHYNQISVPGHVGGAWPQNKGFYSDEVITGTTVLGSTLPPYKSLYYIMY